MIETAVSVVGVRGGGGVIGGTGGDASGRDAIAGERARVDARVQMKVRVIEGGRWR